MARDIRKLRLNPYEKRRRDTERKLREALERLVKGLPTLPELQKRSYRLTVTTLAQEARIGLNAIYANHRAVIEDLHRADQQRVVPDKLARWEDKLAQQRSLLQVLQIEERRLVTENAALLKRLLDAETAAGRHQKQNARLIAERDEALKPILLVPRK